MDTASAECPSNSTELTKKTSSIEDIFQPHDYVRATTEDGKQCLVPQFLIDEYEHMQKSLDNAKEMGVDQASGGPLCLDDLPHGWISPIGVMAPVVPGHTERELLLYHGEVKALQEMHGISYKDAAHRLYHSEVKKLLTEDDVRTKIGDICENIAAKVDKDIRNRIREIDERASELATDDS
ncbi:hypothetical protein BGW80DRAFT_1565487 [Lactifluus volemus]|nr:hypothetical protein BGW80DRAFT_1565487 [Lactifluus volemus]